ncbi:hypothetical protein I8U20_14345, partial [Thermoactinomyces intermedius]
PKIAPAAMKVYKKLDCLVYEQPADSYVAMMLLPNGRNCESEISSITIKATKKEVDGKEYLLFGDNPKAKYKKSELLRINTDMEGGRKRAEEVFRELGKEHRIEPDDPRQGWSRIYDKNDNMLAQFRTKNDGSVNIDVWMNGVYEDIHFKP